MEGPFSLEEKIRAAINVAPVMSEPLSGGCVGKAFRVHLPDGTSIAAKVDDLYPLLVHVRLFGGSYVSAVERTLRRFGH